MHLKTADPQMSCVRESEEKCASERAYVENVSQISSCRVAHLILTLASM